jgi:hypothetical protein
MSLIASPCAQGCVSRGFEVVREAFTENFARRHELGGGCCAYHQGTKVVDLWAVFETRRVATRGRRTRWLSCTRPPRAWPR